MKVNVLTDASTVAEICNKLDNACEGYTLKEGLSGLLTVVTWALVDISEKSGIPIEEIVKSVYDGLSDSTSKLIRIHKNEMQ